MADELSELAAWTDALTAKLNEGGRRALTRQVGIEIARSQRRRIAAQRNPDGSAFAPRKPKEEKRGKIRRKAAGPMFRRLRTPKFLRMQNDASSAEIGFTGAAGRIAGVHQYGLRDRVSRRAGAPEVSYPERRLLGPSAEDRDRIMDIVLEHVAD